MLAFAASMARQVRGSTCGARPDACCGLLPRCAAPRPAAGPARRRSAPSSPATWPRSAMSCRRSRRTPRSRRAASSAPPASAAPGADRAGPGLAEHHPRRPAPGLAQPGDVPADRASPAGDQHGPARRPCLSPRAAAPARPSRRAHDQPARRIATWSSPHPASTASAQPARRAPSIEHRALIGRIDQPAPPLAGSAQAPRPGLGPTPWPAPGWSHLLAQARSRPPRRSSAPTAARRPRHRPSACTSGPASRPARRVPAPGLPWRSGTSSSASSDITPAGASGGPG